MKDEISLWDDYGRFFVTEEDIVFSRDLSEDKFYRDFTEVHTVDCVELGAGHGRLRQCLKTKGIFIGLDSSETMLSLWREEDQTDSFRVQSLAQNIPLAENSVDTVIFPYNGIHCIPLRFERQKVLRESFRVLKPGGVFLMEACPAFNRRQEETDVVRYDHHWNETSLKLTETIERDNEKGTITFYMTYSGGEVKSSECACIEMTLQIISREELLADTESSGMQIVDVWGDYDLSEWDEEMSPRFLVHAVKSSR